jgi:hypothetical protein
VFLDFGTERNSILIAFEEGKKKAEGGSPAVMIGTVWSADLAETLTELYRPLAEEGFSLSTIARPMMEEAHARPRH